ncbi:MAG: GH13_31 / GH13_40 / GH13_29 / GH13_23 / GH 13 / GH13_17 / GH13_30 / GH13_36 / GH13_16 / GH13 _35 / GH13_20 / GH13_4 / GH13_1 / GH13_2 / GH13 _21 / GH13_19 / GH13_26 [uncultured Blastococcus sp.]|uniref:GH13_31 / GH13_40 / GH13_29 / GH13_23 / GH 13 / GH13_17 / GH13_30 / GH13_36 / GH13_16 / GH13 _35 / GH13_20 / GH13_4 / GH13_1 / GH13_2 / GH13 _21 / GH13_19 / GH13_26 n=1 Tax=uncultured Blastococcus sp. TaxID=217144 RepID=A0A6J4HH83_9ACTN|nr:MAG: GH13_31 / GH13_40 / GH13_29 / GH13_23 / GH 13 / GH13_17 / GH13_30 / GH13_36 / GH13_16 / GH13 _35 / GH13_20 / GH13_4 / GH13_1 / GH13_2 / GH13 _21 / GH13_19 / GH13_26 [uncultured Blastococcus sp.]
MDPEHAPWWTRAVAYQVYPRSFQDSDGDGIGDLGGVLQRLDHLADLGVDILWLSPVYPSPQADNGYDISDYTDVDPLFGTLAQLDELIAALHARGMRLLMDLVVNHTSDEHPWFVESRSSKDSAKRDWYWWRPPRPGFAAGAPGAEPTNWQSFFSGPTWEYDEASGEYYLHLFDRKQPDLNWENPEVRQAVYAMMRWWLDRGVDGFRMDVINMISKDLRGVDGAAGGHLHDGPPLPGSSLGDGSASYLCGPRIHEFLAEMHREVFTGREGALLTVGEMPGVTVEQARLFTDPARAEVDMVFQFEHVGLDHGTSKWDLRPLRLRDLKASFGRWQAGLADVGWNSLYWDNHDQPRAVSRFGDDSPRYRRDSATCLATLLHLHRGTPYVFQGQEIGMANHPFATVDDFRDLESVNHFGAAMVAGEDPTAVLAALRVMSRDNARTPVQWDGSPNAGFTTGTPWLPVNPDSTEWNAAAQRTDPDSVLAHYRRLIALRHEEPVVALGEFAMLLPEHDDVYAFTRTLEHEVLLVVCNVSATPYPLAELLPEAASGRLVLGNLRDEDPALLRPWEARVLRLS